MTVIKSEKCDICARPEHQCRCRGPAWQRVLLEASALAVLGFRLSPREVAFNSEFFVQITSENYPQWGEVQHLWIRRNDCQPIHSWSRLQEIKNELCGFEALAIEVYPRESELVDHVNVYHLWVLPNTTELPFGLRGRPTNERSRLADSILEQVGILSPIERSQRR